MLVHGSLCAVFAALMLVQLATLSCAGNLPESTNPTTYTTTFSVFDAAQTYNPQVVDIDGDGLLDLTAVSAADGGQAMIFYGTATQGTYDGPYYFAGFPRYSHLQNWWNWADLDLDGTPDLILSWTNGVVQVVSLSDRTARPPVVGESSTVHGSVTGAAYGTFPQLVDLDGDGDLDYLYGDGDGLAVLLNPHANALVDLGAEAWDHQQLIPKSADVSFAFPHVGDLDGDGDLDVVVSGADSSLMLVENLGGVPAVWAEAILLASVSGYATASSLAVADLDNDGRADVCTGTSNKTYVCVLSLPTVASTASDAPFVLVADVTVQASNTWVAGHPILAFDSNLDGHIDLFMRDSRQNTYFVENYGNGTLAAPTQVSSGGLSGYTHVALADLSGDGVTDVLISNWNDNTFKVAIAQPSTPYYFDPSETLLAVSGDVGEMLAVDLDGDGNLDLLWKSWNGVSLRWSRALDASGKNFAAYETIDSDLVYFDSRALDVGDIDGDNTTDILAAMNNSIAWWSNDNGDGSVWTYHDAVSQAEMTQNARSVSTLHDLDRDGDLDVVWAMSDKLYWRENDGAGNFDGPMIEIGGHYRGRSLHFCDINGDGLEDIVQSATNGLLWRAAESLSPGNVAFASSQSPISVSSASASYVGCADFNGDSHFDVYAYDNGEIRIFINPDGLGSFPDGDTVVASTELNVWDLSVLDVDGDGDLDIFALTDLKTDDDTPSYPVILLNPGDGQFVTDEYVLAASPSSSPSSDQPTRGGLADLNGDGVPDVYTSSRTYAEVYMGLGAGARAPLTVRISHSGNDTLCAENPTDYACASIETALELYNDPLNVAPSALGHGAIAIAFADAGTYALARPIAIYGSAQRRVYIDVPRDGIELDCSAMFDSPVAFLRQHCVTIFPGPDSGLTFRGGAVTVRGTQSTTTLAADITGASDLRVGRLVFISSAFGNLRFLRPNSISCDESVVGDCKGADQLYTPTYLVDHQALGSGDADALHILDTPTLDSGAVEHEGCLSISSSSSISFSGLRLADCYSTGGGAALDMVGSSDVSITDFNVTRAQSAGAGGCISLSNSGTLSVSAASISNCESLDAENGGGALFVDTESGPVSFSSTTVESATAPLCGAVAFYQSDPSAQHSIEDSTFTDCHATGNPSLGGGLGSGGAICLSRGALSVTGDSAFNYNTGRGFGGAIVVSSSAYLALTGATLSHNSVSERSGGALFFTSATAIISQTDFFNNSAEHLVNGGGGSIGCQDTDLTASGVTITSSTAGGIGGGAFMCVGSAASSSTAVAFTSTQFSSNSAYRAGGAVLSEDCPMQFGSAVVFSDNQVAVDLAGATSLAGIEAEEFELAGGAAIHATSSSAPLSIADGTTFSHNVAHLGHGGAVFFHFTDISNVPQFGNGVSFSNNQAVLGGGGAIYWVPLDSTSSTNDEDQPVPANMAFGVILSGNSALYGSNVATRGLFVGWTDRSVEDVEQTSREALSGGLTVGLFDFYSNVVATDSDTDVWIESQAQDVTLLGEGVRTKFVNGIVDWSSGTLAVEAAPGQVHELEVATSMTQFAVSDATPFMIAMRNCTAGEEVEDGLRCSPCSIGRYAETTQSETCEFCPPGRAGNTTGAAICAECQPGYFSSTAGALQCSACPRGTVSTAAGAEECTECTDGTYAPNTGMSKCLSCPSGTMSEDGAFACQACPTGWVSVSSESGECTECAAGKYAPAKSGSECLSCPAGTISEAGASSCRECPTGSYTGSENSTACVECPAGMFADSTGSTECSSCPAGTISEAGASSCRECPTGSYSSSENSTSCEDCAAGMFANTTGTAECSVCPAGTSSVSGSRACSACTPGRFASAAQSADCTDCSPGSFAAGSGSTECASAPIGTYVPTSTAVAYLECAAGTYSAVAGSTECTQCALGTFANKTGQSQCEPCAAGSIAPREGAQYCQLCFPGSYQPAKGQTECMFCPEHTVAPEAGYAMCTACEKPTYFDGTGGRDCTFCDPTEFAVFLNGTFDRCDSCPNNALCEVDTGAVKSKSGFWVDTDALTGAVVVFECQPGLCEEGNQCAEGRKPPDENPLCAACEDGLYEWGGECVECDGTRYTVLAILLAIAFVFTCLYHVLSQSVTAELRIAIFFIQMSLLFIGPDSGLVLFVLEIFNARFILASGSQCLIPLDPLERMVATLLSPMLIYAYWLLLVGLAWLRWKAFFAPSGDEVRRMQTVEALPASAAAPSSRPTSGDHGPIHADMADEDMADEFSMKPFWRSLIAIFLLTYNGLVESCFVFFNTVDASFRGGSICVVEAHPAVSCDSDGYKNWRPVYIGVTTIVTGVIPLTLTLVLLQAWRQKRLKLPGFQAVWGLLSQPYRSHLFFYQLFSLVRRTALLAVVVFIADNRTRRFVVASMLNAAFLMVQLQFKPYRQRAENIAATVSLTMLLFITLTAPLFDEPPTDTQDAVLLLMALVPAVGLLAWVIQRKLGTLVASIKRLARTRSASSLKRRRTRNRLQMANLSYGNGVVGEPSGTGSGRRGEASILESEDRSRTNSNEEQVERSRLDSAIAGCLDLRDDGGGSDSDRTPEHSRVGSVDPSMSVPDLDQDDDIV